MCFRYIFQGRMRVRGVRGRRPEASPQRSLHQGTETRLLNTLAAGGTRGRMRHLRCTGCGSAWPPAGLPRATVRRHRAWPRKYTVADVALLAETDALYDTLSGPATQNLLQRALLVFGDTRTARLASISVAHLYHLRSAAGYRARRQQGTKTRATGIDRGAPGDRGHLASGFSAATSR